MTNHLKTLKRLAELQKDATKGPWKQTSYKSTIPEAYNTIRGEDGVIAWTCCEIPKFLDSLSAAAWKNAKAKVFKADAALIAQSGSTDFAALAEYVEGLERENSTLRNIAARNATIAECGE